MSMLAALAITAGAIVLFNLLFNAPWPLLLLALVVSLVHIDRCLRQCRAPLPTEEDSEETELTYRGRSYLLGKSTDVSLSPQQDLHYRGNIYRPSQTNTSNNVQLIESSF